MSLPTLPEPWRTDADGEEHYSPVCMKAYGQQCWEAALQAVMGIPITGMTLTNTYKADIDMSNKRALEVARKPDVRIPTSGKSGVLNEQ